MCQQIATSENDQCTTIATQLTELIDQVQSTSLIVAKKPNLEALRECAFNHADQECRKAALLVLHKLLQKITDKKEATKGISKDDLEDDQIVRQDSDDEDENLDPIENSSIEVLIKMIPLIEENLSKPKQSLQPLQQAFSSELKKPFGVERLRSVELLHQIVRLRKPAILKAVNES